MTKPKPKERMHARIERTWTNHPMITLSTVIGVVTLISLVAPGVLWAINHFQTVEDSKRLEQELRGLIANYQTANARTTAWAQVQAIKNEVVALRNRANDCDIKSDKKDRMTPLERQACSQYQEEFEDATRRFNEARKAALDTTKEK